MIELSLHDEKYLPVCRHYKAVFTTPCIQEDKLKMKEVCSISTFAVLNFLFKKQNVFIYRYIYTHNGNLQTNHLECSIRIKCRSILKNLHHRD